MQEPALHRFGQPDAERLHRELQQEVPRRVPKPALVRKSRRSEERERAVEGDYNGRRPHRSLQ